MKQTLAWGDTLGLGLMVFSFFFGAGNLIFPPLAGQLAGQQVGWALGGFMLSSVLLPIAAILAIARSGSFTAMMSELPKEIAVTVTLIAFSLMGPLFVTPRTGIVVFDVVCKPLLGEGKMAAQFVVTTVFFAMTLLFCWNRGGLIDAIGKIITPVLFLLLVGLALGVLLFPQGSAQAPQAAYQSHPLAQGFIEGYQTMDTFGSLMFGSLIVEVLRAKGITDPRRNCYYLIVAGLIAAVGLAFVYCTLFALGATSAIKVPQATTGVEVLTCYVQGLLGSWGLVLLGIVVFLACITTAVGLLSGFADYMATITSRNYRFWIVISTIISTLVANMELSTMMTLSQPLLTALYPVVIAIVVLTLCRHRLPNPRRSYHLMFSLALVSGILDSLRTIKVDLRVLHCIPGFEQGVGWMLPSCLLLLFLCFIRPVGNQY